MIYFYALLLILVLLVGWVLTVLGGPGNWLMVGAAAAPACSKNPRRLKVPFAGSDMGELQICSGTRLLVVSVSPIIESRLQA